MRATRIVMPAEAKKGSVVEIKTLISHVMETGYRRDSVGKPIPRDIIQTFTVTYGGEEVFRADLGPGIAANPFFAFSTTATETGDIVFSWKDLNGEETRETRRLTVT
ncbi:MAG: thiosulfate oxidation carrier complex protein SoxZ [Hyphomicrobiaceae bacterium]|nr:MAG: thiosulfate oxidation carrier complex protein SoxZ [Hyphomicrobiaceae bacterium]